ncbi:MAG: hypothetical protein N4A48_12060 [Tepidibacter sp.]|uniref:hypothetical protein n=1 Tax=Tepidibacter sp. TaxID=2529387 RepID=UPI0025D2A4C8|nr:hypothetical protein [Tepidibacter sp.]MCT4509465.1 hypothetical protein [Tepidibacter sp.]
MEDIKTSKKELFWCTIILIVFMIVHLFYMNLSSDGKFPNIWIGLIVGSIIGELSKDSREGIYKRIFIRCSISIIMILNYILFRFSIYIPNYMILLTIFGVYLIYLYRTNIDKHIRILCCAMLCILTLFFYIDYQIKSNNIIKDINFRRYISKEYGIKGKIESSDLENIEKLSIYDSSHINSIEGIEYFRNLKRLTIDDAYKIKDFSWLPQLNGLNYLMIWYMDLDDLESIEEIKSLKHLEVVYPKYGELKSLKKFPNLEKLDIQGIDYMKNLDCIKGPKNIENLGLADSQIVTFDGIEEFKKLEELYLYEISSSDTSKVFELENLQKVSMQGCNLYKQNEFIQKLKDKGIEVEIIEYQDLPF